MTGTKLPPEIIITILNRLPVHKLIQLQRKETPYVDQILLQHPIFRDRQVYVCLSGCGYQPPIAIGKPLTQVAFTSKHVKCTPSSSPTDTVYALYVERLDLSEIHDNYFEFMPYQANGTNWVHQSQGSTDYIMVAIVLAHNGIVYKRSIHAIKAPPNTAVKLARKEGYFEGNIELESNEGNFVRITRCQVGQQWFCSEYELT